MGDSETAAGLDAQAAASLREGIAIPAHPLALTADRRLDERRQRALSRYYIAAGAGGLAVGVHTTQFAIRQPDIGLFEPVLAIAKEEMDRADASRQRPLVRIGGICGKTDQAVREAQLLRGLGYHAGLLSLGAMKEADDEALIAHCQQVGRVIPLMGFYLQAAVGGRVLSYRFWRRLCELPSLTAIKIAAFNRYQTFDVMRAVAESGRDDIALYTGNDDHIVLDLLTPYHIAVHGQSVERRFVGGLLGHWAVWTRRGVEQQRQCREISRSSSPLSPQMLALAEQVTDANAVFFDAANHFAGCIPGLHEVLRRQGLLAGIWCLDPEETLSRGQIDEIDRVYQSYPHLNDDHFVREHLQSWLSG